MKKCFYLLFVLLFVFDCNSQVPQLLWQKAGQESSTSCILFSNEGKYLFINGYRRDGANESKTLQMWDVNEKTLVKEIQCNLEYDAMDVSPDNKFIIGCNAQSNIIEVVNIETSLTTLINKVVTKNFMFPGIFSLGFSTDGTTIYAYEYSFKRLQRFDLHTLDSLPSLYVGNMRYITFSDDGSILSAINSDTTVSVWDLETEQELIKIKTNSLAHNTMFSSDKKYLIINYDSTQTKNTIEVRSVEAGDLLSSSTSSFRYPYSIFARDNETVITSTFPTGLVDLWNFKTGQHKTTEIELYGPNMVCSPTENWLAGRDYSQNTKIYDINTLEKLLDLKAQCIENLYYCADIFITHDNKKVYICGSNNPEPGNSGKIKVYDLMTGNLNATYSISAKSLADFYLSKNGKKIAACDYDGKVYLLNNEEQDTITIEKTYSFSGMSFRTVILSNDNKRIIACGSRSGVQYINTETDEIRQFDTAGLNIQSAAINSDGSKLILGTKEKYVYVLEYDAINDEFKRVNYFLSDSSTNPNYVGISYVGFSNDDKYIIVCASDKKTYIYDGDTYKMVKFYQPMSGWISNTNVSAALSKNNIKLFVANSASLRIFDVGTADELWMDDSFRDKFKQGSSFKTICLSDDDKYLAYCSDDGSLGLYDVSEITDVKENIFNEQFSIYPNPAKDYLNIKLSESFKLSESYKVEIYSALGTKILETKYQDKIDISLLSTGIYFLKIGDMVCKFVKMI